MYVYMNSSGICIGKGLAAYILLGIHRYSSRITCVFLSIAVNFPLWQCNFFNVYCRFVLFYKPITEFCNWLVSFMYTNTLNKESSITFTVCLSLPQVYKLLCTSKQGIQGWQNRSGLI